MGRSNSKQHTAAEESLKPASPAVEGAKLRHKVLKRRNHSPVHIFQRATITNFELLCTFVPIGLCYLLYRFEKLREGDLADTKSESKSLLRKVYLKLGRDFKDRKLENKAEQSN